MSNPQKLWRPDAGTGKYRNPILYADFSDPDAVRVGDDYFMTASSFSNAPGLPVLHSRDLTHWRLVNYALPALPGERFERPCHGAGVWAPAIRYHAGKFWIFFPMPDEGIFMTQADDPRGAWSEPVCVKAAKGWIDPCPFWDDDGRAYLVNAFAKSRSGVKSKLCLTRMRPDGTALEGESRIIFDGTDTQPTIEGPKMYKRGGYYYILAPAGGVPHGWQTALRAKNIFGPYEQKIVMMRGESDVNGPHQGALVDGADGKEWFLHFQDAGVCGRIVHLQPVCWKDGWPVIGREHDGEGWGEPVAEYETPAGGMPPCEEDERRFGQPGLDWQWNANGRAEWLTLGERMFELHAQPRADALCDQPALLLHRFEAPAFEARVRLETLEGGATAGMIALGRRYGALALHGENAAAEVSLICGEIGGREEARPLGRVDVRGGADIALLFDGTQCRFRLETADGTLTPEPFPASAGVWTGEKYGVFALGGKGGARFSLPEEE